MGILKKSRSLHLARLKPSTHIKEPNEILKPDLHMIAGKVLSLTLALQRRVVFHLRFM